MNDPHLCSKLWNTQHTKVGLLLMPVLPSSSSCTCRLPAQTPKLGQISMHVRAQEGQTILVQEYMENGDLFHAIAGDQGRGKFSWCGPLLLPRCMPGCSSRH